jgi:hypothetical protein
MADRHRKYGTGTPWVEAAIILSAKQLPSLLHSVLLTFSELSLSEQITASISRRVKLSSTQSESIAILSVETLEFQSVVTSRNSATCKQIWSY